MTNTSVKKTNKQLIDFVTKSRTQYGVPELTPEEMTYLIRIVSTSQKKPGN